MHGSCCNIFSLHANALILGLAISNEDAYLKFKPLFDKGLKLFKFNSEITLEYVLGTNQNKGIRVKFHAKGNNWSL